MDPGYGFFFRLPSEVEHSGGNVNGIMGPGRDTLINNLSSSVNLNFERSKMPVRSSGESPNKSLSDSVNPVSISSSESLAQAKKQVENTAILHPCHLCGKSFAEKDFHFHMPCHYTEILSCNMCSEKFTVKKTLLDHCRTLHAITDPIICELCGKCFSSVDSFQNHQTIHSGDKPYPCEVCFQSFSEKSLLMHHLRTHYSEKPYRCHYCGKGFTLKGNLKIHVQGHEGIKPFVCEICGKKFTQKLGLNYHMNSHTGKKPYPCEICGKTFSQRGNMKTHMLIHTGERRFSCPECGRLFTQKGNMKTHQKLHLRHPSLQKPYQCLICKRSYVTQASLQCHMVCHQKVSFQHRNVPATSTSMRRE